MKTGKSKKGVACFSRRKHLILLSKCMDTGGVQFVVIKRCPYIIFPLLTCIFNFSLTNEQIATLQKQAVGSFFKGFAADWLLNVYFFTQQIFKRL